MSQLTGMKINDLHGWLSTPSTVSTYTAAEKQVLYLWIHLVDNNVTCVDSSDLNAAHRVGRSPIFATIYPSPVASDRRREMEWVRNRQAS
jgi:hypothetical protein